MTLVPPLLRENITAVILDGGRARRMHGEDKGLIEQLDRPLLDYIIAGLRPQVGSILVNANRNLGRYRGFGYRVIEDILDDFCGPLAGMATAMRFTDCACPSGGNAIPCNDSNWRRNQCCA